MIHLHAQVDTIYRLGTIKTNYTSAEIEGLIKKRQERMNSRSEIDYIVSYKLSYEELENNTLFRYGMINVSDPAIVSEEGKIKGRLHKKVPDFELEDFQKNKVIASAFFDKPTIFLFYRGNWCPLCMAQIKEIAKGYKALKQRNVNVVFISSQPHKYTKSLAEKFDLQFNFLVDNSNKIAKQLGILSKNGIPMGFQLFGYDNDTALPTVIITNKKGTIIFADLTDNYRVRPEPATFFRILDDEIF